MNKSTPINQDTHQGPSFSLRNRLGRVVWNIIAVLFKISPIPLHEFRAVILRCFGAKIGMKTHIYPGVKIWAPWNLDIGDHCGIASGVTLYSQGKITIGRKTVISQGSHLCAGTHDYTKSGFPLITKPIVVGNQCWIAAEAFVHPGVVIADGVVIGARSVVTKNMPAWMVCSGAPCVALKARVITE